jgi:hypothetical protein
MDTDKKMKRIPQILTNHEVRLSFCLTPPPNLLPVERSEQQADVINGIKVMEQIPSAI